MTLQLKGGEESLSDQWCGERVWLKNVVHIKATRKQRTKAEPESEGTPFQTVHLSVLLLRPDSTSNSKAVAVPSSSQAFWEIHEALGEGI